MPFSMIQRYRGRTTDEAEPVDNPREEQQENDRQPGESDKAYELRKAMEETAGGDTRKDKTRE